MKAIGYIILIIVILLIYAVATGEIDTTKIKDNLGKQDDEYPRVEISELVLNSIGYDGQKVQIKARASDGWNYLNDIHPEWGFQISFIDDSGIEMYVKSPVYYQFDYYNPSFNPDASKYIVKGIYHNGKINSIYQNSEGYIEAIGLIEKA